MTTPKPPTGCPACAAGVWMPNCTYGEPDPDRLSESIARLDARPAPTYLDPVRDELDRLRAENEALRTIGTEMGEKVAQYRDATVPALESNADGWAKRAREAEAARDEFEKSYVHFHAAYEQAEARVDQLTDDLALINDTLRHRTASHKALVATRLACPRCSTLPIEETPGE